MSKKFKKVSALLLAVVMMLGMSVMASAQDLNVYLREYDSTVSPATITYPFGTGVAFTVKDVSATDTVAAALMAATSNNVTRLGIASALNTSWTNYSGTYYLNALSVTRLNSDNETVTYTRTNTPSGEGYSDLVYEDGVAVSGKWTGYSWMWQPGNALGTINYPDDALSDRTCGSVSYSIILSFDKSSFSW